MRLKTKPYENRPDEDTDTPNAPEDRPEETEGDRRD